MYDSVTLKLSQDNAKRVDFLSETSCFINVEGEHTFNNGEAVISGNIDKKLKVSITRHGVKISGGSICKWYLGDNMQTLGRKETQMAIERVSDTLHLPFEYADVTRIDVAQNLIVKYEPEIYLNHLGTAPHYNRFLQTGSLYYQNAKRQLVFYDKTREQKAKHEIVPEIYQGRKVLRYEMRFKRRLKEQFNLPEIKADLLYNEAFYMGIEDRWLYEYKAIQKLNEVVIDFEKMKTKRELYVAGLLSLTEKAGGELAMLEQINEAFKMGKVTKKQAYDLKQAVKEACEADFATEKSEVISELDEKVKQAVRFYR
jgi:hypothetical protein